MIRWFSEGWDYLHAVGRTHTQEVKVEPIPAFFAAPAPPRLLVYGRFWRTGSLAQALVVLAYVRVYVLSRFSYVWLYVTLWTIAHQAPLSMGSSRQEYWSGLPCPPPGHLPSPGIKPMSLTSPALGGGFFITSATWLVRSTHHFPLHSQDVCLTDSRMTKEQTYSMWKVQKNDAKQ